MKQPNIEMHERLTLLWTLLWNLLRELQEKKAKLRERMEYLRPETLN